MSFGKHRPGSGGSGPGCLPWVFGGGLIAVALFWLWLTVQQQSGR